MDSSFGTTLGWLLAGVFLGWLGNWLFDRLYRRDGPAAGELSALRLEGLSAEIDGLRAEVTDLRQGLAAARAAAQPPSPPGPATATPPAAPAAPALAEAAPPSPSAEAGGPPLSPMELLARRASVAAQPLWSAQDDLAAQARLEALRDYQSPGAAPASPA